MKASNKILLAILLVGFGYLTIAQVALHLKYVNKDIIGKEEFNAFFYNDFEFANINQVQLEGIGECEIVFSDAVRLLVEKNSFSNIRFNRERNKLIVRVKDPRAYLASSKFNWSLQKVKLFIQPGTQASAVNSNISIKGSIKTPYEPSYHFMLDGSNLFTRRNYFVDSLRKYFDTLSVQAVNNSQVILFYNDHFKYLSSNLEHSTINDYHAQIDQADIITDSSSVMVIAGGNISKLKATVIKK